MTSSLGLIRSDFQHDLMNRGVYVRSKGKPTNADGGGKLSVRIADDIAATLGGIPVRKRLSPQSIGVQFEDATSIYLERSLNLFNHLRPRNLVSAPGAG